MNFLVNNFPKKCHSITNPSIGPLLLSHHVKLWASYNLMNARNGKSMSKISKWPSLVIVTVVVVVVDFIGEGNI